MRPQPLSPSPRRGEGERESFHALAVLAACLLAAGAAPAQTPLQTRNVVLIVTDGLRWQEVFNGADPALMDREHGRVDDTTALRHDFLRDTPEQRRAALLPFFWSAIARRGQIYGNPATGSPARVTNGLKFSYPGYNELFTGAPDPRIDRNDYGPNPNVTVFEWLNGFPDYRGRVAAFATWDAFADIFNRDRAGILVRAGWEGGGATGGPETPRQALVDELYRTTTRLWDNNVFDALLHAAVKEYLPTGRPRVLFIGYGETDEWAHAGRYDLYLRAAHQVDAFIAELWDALQALPEYRNQTTFIITTDHGRGGGGGGSGLTEWRNHGRHVEGAEHIWIAVLGPDTPPLGERAQTEPVTQAQVAATIAALLGRDWRAAFSAAAPPLADAIQR